MAKRTERKLKYPFTRHHLNSYELSQKLKIPRRLRHIVNRFCNENLLLDMNILTWCESAWVEWVGCRQLIIKQFVHHDIQCVLIMTLKASFVRSGTRGKQEESCYDGFSVPLRFYHTFLM